MSRPTSFIMRYRWLGMCLSVIFLLSLIPLLPAALSGDVFGDVINPRYTDSYYTPMVREVADGYPLLGNPFFFEHRESVTPAFILPFLVSAAPLFVGMSLPVTVVFNFILWSLVFGIIVYALMRRLGLSDAWAFVATTLVYVHLYGQLIRPVSMQVVQPVFMLFILAFFFWWERPANKYRDALLGLAIAITLYDYTYLLQIIIVFLGLVFVYLLYTKDWRRIAHALIVGVYASVLGIPFLALTFTQLHDANYADSMFRIGLAYTHLPAGEAFIGGARILSLLALAYVTWKWLFRTRELSSRPNILQFLAVGIAIEIVAFANVITGLDLETASHAARFVAVWLVIGSLVAVYYLFSVRRSIGDISILKKIILGLLVVLVGASNIAYAQDVLGYFDLEGDRAQREEMQAMLPAFEWLDQHEARPIVVWTDPDTYLSIYVTMYTKHYVLYASPGILQLVSSDETEERFLLASAVSKTTQESITNDVWMYDGAGAAADTPNTVNRSVKICRALQLESLGFSCGELTNARTLYAAHYAEMYERYKAQILPNLKDELKKFHVSYILKDVENDTDFHPESLSYAKEVYSDGRFVIYKI